MVLVGGLSGCSFAFHSASCARGHARRREGSFGFSQHLVLARLSSLNNSMSSKSHVDFESVGLYVVGAQCITATMLTSFLSVAMGWAQASSRSPALRTLTIITAVAAVATAKPLRITKSRGLDHVFRASRPGVYLYVVSLVVEQVATSCDAGTAATIVSQVERAVSLTVTVSLLVGGLLQSWWPLGDRDLVPFVISTACLLVLAMWPLAPPVAAAPFCTLFSIHEAGVRLARGIVFSVVYTVHAYACLPVNLDSQDLVVVPLRSSVASIWVLLTPLPTLLLAALQLPVVVSRRSASRTVEGVEYDGMGGTGGENGVGSSMDDVHSVRALTERDDGDDGSSCASCASDQPLFSSPSTRSAFREGLARVSPSVAFSIADAVQTTGQGLTMEPDVIGSDTQLSNGGVTPLQLQRADDGSTHASAMQFFPRQSKVFKSVSGPGFHEIAQKIANGVDEQDCANV